MTKLINPVILLLSLGLLIWNPYPFKILELSTFDYLMSKSPTIQNENILLVDLDEEIVEAYGGYPLPRSLFASMIDRTEGSIWSTLIDA